MNGARCFSRDPVTHLALPRGFSLLNVTPASEPCCVLQSPSSPTNTGWPSHFSYLVLKIQLLLCNPLQGELNRALATSIAPHFHCLLADKSANFIIPEISDRSELPDLNPSTYLLFYPSTTAFMRLPPDFICIWNSPPVASAQQTVSSSADSLVDCGAKP